MRSFRQERDTASGERVTVFALPRCRVVLHGASGAIIGWKAFLREAVPISDGRKRPVLIALLLLGLGVLVGLLV